MRVRNTADSTTRAGAAPAPGPARIGPADGAGRPGSAAGPVDVASIAGIPTAELTPNVQAALGQLMAEVHQLREDLGRAQRRITYLEDLADQDSLVPVLNRRAFVRELARLISFAERYGAPGSVLYFDIDGMKRINDTHGHAAGDAVLTRVAEALTGHSRGSDVVGRLGGDEFGVILAQADGAAAAAKAQSLVDGIHAEPLTRGGAGLAFDVSYGVYTFGGGEEVEAALEAADRAMYAHKQRLAIRR